MSDRHPAAPRLGPRRLAMHETAPALPVGEQTQREGVTLVLRLFFAIAAVGVAIFFVLVFGRNARPSTANLLLVSGAVVALSGVLGVLVARVLLRSQRAARQHERRFRQLLAIAADWYWEQDASRRFAAVRSGGSDGAWAEPAASASPARLVDGLAQLDPAVLAAGRSIRDLVAPCPEADGRPGYVALSGEPVVDEAGHCHGYWGIARSVTVEVEARRQLEANELLYRELFNRASTAFVFHRGGRILQVNAAAATLFGHDSPQALVGLDIFDHIPPDHRDLSRQRFGLLEGSSIGTAMPAVDLPMRTRDGRALAVQASTVRIAMADGPANLSILTDMTEREAAERALADAKEQAEAANRGKSRFLANMSHEVRTPLNGIYGLAQLALSEELPAARRQDYLRQIVASAEHLTGLLSDVLDLSKIEAGELTVESVVFDLRAMLEAIGQSYHDLAAEKSLSFALDIAPTMPTWVRGDPTRTRQIIANYLSNALKLTSGGSIALSAAPCEGDRLRVTVRDTGIGVDTATRRRLFKPFIQADDSTTRRYGGTGLGLSICGELAAQLGGTVGIDSEPGQGSSFWVELPLPATTSPEEHEAVGGADRDPAGGRTLNQVRLLVVEDNPVNMMIAIAMLERWGARVTPATNGRLALEVFDTADKPFDAVLMDVHMPVMDGIDATLALRQRVGARELPIIAMTAAVLEQDLAEAFDAGMNDFVSKPFAADRLLATVARWTVNRSNVVSS